MDYNKKYFFKGRTSDQEIDIIAPNPFKAWVELEKYHKEKYGLEDGFHYILTKVEQL